MGKLKPEDVRGKIIVGSEMGRLRGVEPAMVILAAAGQVRMMNMMPPVMPALQGTPGRSPYPTLLTADESFGKWVAGLPPGPVADATATGKVGVADRDFELRNVVGVLPGSDPALRDSYVLVTAHYDHIGELSPGEGDRIRNGANDDASGTATMLAVARMLSSGKPKPKRTVVFIAWTGEEAGGLGSQWYAKHPLFPLSKTVAMINLEQTGRYDGEGGAGKNRVFVTGYGYSDVGKMLTEAAKPAGLEVYAGSDDFFGRSDNLFLALAGVPAHTVGSSLEFPDYHGVGDSAEKLDYENMAVIARGVAAGVLAIANSASEPQWSDAQGAAPYRKVRAAEAGR
jgi:Zn-dependent M28 family amino/carboxypeptidase